MSSGMSGPVAPKSLSSQQAPMAMGGQPNAGINPGAGAGPAAPPKTLIDPSYSTANPFAVAPMMDESGPRQGRYWNDRFGGDVMSGQARGRGLMTS